MKNIFLLMYASMFLPAYAQIEHNNTCSEHVTFTDKLERMTFDDACVLLGYMSGCRVYYQPEKEVEWFIILDLLRDEL